MKDQFDPRINHEQSRESIGYVPRKQATQQDYDRIGFKSGLEVHQQLKTKRKLFCNCPAGHYHKSDIFDAEVIRHMRPTLSELGEYDGTALMEFKTRKNILYRIKNETTCTYEVDDTPPFLLNREALDISILISLLSKLSIVGEVHITRKQYLDGSIPTGFQRTAIIGVEGEIYLKNKTVRLIQLSLEEDSCREISDIGHLRVYKTDRLGMPLIETVTYPEMLNPDEVKEACDYIRFLGRSTGMVRTGIGAGRQDVNVSCKGGTRVEIKGVAHTKWIPELTHNECFRQWALLKIKEILLSRIADPSKWKPSHKELAGTDFNHQFDLLRKAEQENLKLIAVNLPGFHGILSHFTQPEQSFASEISDRLKVIACIEKPNMTHSEAQFQLISDLDMRTICTQLGSGDNDAQILFWGPEEDIKTALEVIEERCRMAFEGVPNETRKALTNGTTIFERVLPGADRMYPDTDSAPIPLENSDIDRLGQNLPTEIIDRYKQLKQWGIPEDTYTYIFSKNHYPLIESIINECGIKPSFAGTFFGHFVKFVEGHYKPTSLFRYEQIRDLFIYLRQNELDPKLAKRMLPLLYEHPKMDFDSILLSIGFKKTEAAELFSKIPYLEQKFAEICRSDKPENRRNWIMGQLSKTATGNVNLTELSKKISG